MQLRRRAGSESGAPDNHGKCFPRLQRFPAPQITTDQRRESLMSGIAEGGGAEGGIQARGAGFKRGGRVLMSQVGFPMVAPPARTAVARCARDDGLTSLRSEGRTQGSGACRRAGFQDEYSWV